MDRNHVAGISVSIRAYVSDDREEWRRMREALWPGSGIDSDLDAWLHRRDAVVFVAVRAEGGLGGFVEAATRPYAEGCDTSPVAFLEGWYVDPDLRRQGVGRALVAAVEAWARANGLQEFASDALIDNDVSHQAHGRLGFQEVERIVCFRKSLTAPR
jgi:aminoglycoside 6'-N-acetyltransferase I